MAHGGEASGQTGALARNRAASSQLSVVARRLRFSNARRSRIYSAVGLRPRLKDVAFRLLVLSAFVFSFLAPNALAIAYYGFLASDQFESETRFTVSVSAPLLRSDALAEFSGIPSAKIAQDTQIVENFITSRAMLAILEEEADFVRVYGRGDADFYMRLPEDSTVEDRLDYWEDMVDTSIAPRSGIITVKVRAFSAGDANRIAGTIVKASERLINDLNQRIWNDATASAQLQVERSTQLLSAAREKLQTARNEAGILTVESSAGVISALLTQLEGELIGLENTYRANAQSLSEEAPQMRLLARQIATKVEQISELREQLAGENLRGETLADASSRFSQINLEVQVSEQQLAAAIKALEQIQFSSRQQFMYLDPFLAPTMPESAEFPQRFLWIALTFLASSFVFGLLWALIAWARRRLD